MIRCYPNTQGDHVPARWLTPTEALTLHVTGDLDATGFNRLNPTAKKLVSEFIQDAVRGRHVGNVFFIGVKAK